MTDEKPTPRWTLGDLATDPDKSVNGVRLPVPGKDGLFATISYGSAAAWLKWLEDYPASVREDRGWDDEDAERAFYGGHILRDLGPLFDENGEPMEFTPELGEQTFTASKTVRDARTGEERKVYTHDSLYQWIRIQSMRDELFAGEIAGN